MTKYRMTSKARDGEFPREQCASFVINKAVNDPGRVRIGKSFTGRCSQLAFLIEL